MNVRLNPWRDKRSFCQPFPRVCTYVGASALLAWSTPNMWVRIHYLLEVPDLCIWFNATMMDDMVIRALPKGLGPSYLVKVKVNGYEAHNRVATWWAHWNTSCVPWRHPSYIMLLWRESSVSGRSPEKSNSITANAHACLQHWDGCFGMGDIMIVNQIFLSPNGILGTFLILCYFWR